MFHNPEGVMNISGKLPDTENGRFVAEIEDTVLSGNLGSGHEKGTR